MMCCNRFFQDGKNTGLQIRCMMGIWLFFKVKKRSFFQSRRKMVLMSTRSIQNSHLHPLKLIVSSWHSEIGLDGMAIVNLNGLVAQTINHCHLPSYPNARYRFLDSNHYSSYDPLWLKTNYHGTKSKTTTTTMPQSQTSWLWFNQKHSKFKQLNVLTNFFVPYSNTSNLTDDGQIRATYT